MKRLVHNARVLVTDGAKALILRNDGDVASPSLTLIDTIEQENPPNHEQGSERPGRTRVDSTRRAAVDTTDWHAQAEDAFVSEVAARMDRDLQAKEYTHLVVVAAPVALGTYRKAVSASVSAATVHEIAKDLTHHKPGEIADIVRKELDAAE